MCRPLWRSWLAGNISALRDHPAILSWYICDDCCPFAAGVAGPIGNVSLYDKRLSHAHARTTWHTHTRTY